MDGILYHSLDDDTRRRYDELHASVTETERQQRLEMWRQRKETDYTIRWWFMIISFVVVMLGICTAIVTSDILYFYGSIAIAVFVMISGMVLTTDM